MRRSRRLTVRVYESEAEALREVSERYGLSYSELMRIALSNLYIDDVEKYLRKKEKRDV